MRSCRVLVLLSAIFIGISLADPLVLQLKDYLQGAAKAVGNVEDGANLYLASNDNSDDFKNIQIVTGGTTHSLSEISTLNPDGTPKSISISGGLTISTTNDNSVTNGLTGYLYITTAQQAQDPLFKVYVISGTHHISITGVQTTTVILNTQFMGSSGDADQPQKNSYISQIQQPSDSAVNFQWGVPSATYKTDIGNKFFENPINIPNSDHTAVARHFFDHVEPLQVGLDYWYITTAGPVTLTVQNNYVSSHVYNTTGVSTTGLIINNNFIFDEHVVYFQSDPTRARTIGSLISTTIPRQHQVNFIFSDATGNSIVNTYDNSFSNVSETVMNADFAATQLTVNSSQLIPGVFYCQYFTFSTALLPTTVTAATTTPGAPPVTQVSSQSTGSSQSVTVGSTVTSGIVTGPQTQPTGATSGTNTPSTSTVWTTTKSSRSLLTDLFISFFVLLSVFYY